MIKPPVQQKWHHCWSGWLMASLLLINSGLAQAAAHRIVSVGGIVTEIIYLLGEQNRLVATDTSSIYPSATTTLPKVGYQRTLSVEGVLAQKPDLILLSDMAGPAPVVSQLFGSGVPVQTIATPRTPAEIGSEIITVANALGVPEKGKAAALQVDQALVALKPLRNSQSVRVLFVLQMGGAPMAAGAGTAPDTLFHLAGVENAATGFHGYQPLTPEALAAARPDVVMVTDQGMKQGGANAVWQIQGMAQTPAAQHQRLIHLDALLALGLGPRTPLAVTQLQQGLQGIAHAQ